MATETDRAQGFARESVYYLLNVFFIRIAVRERKHYESGIRGRWQRCDKPGVAFVHGKDSRPLFQVCFRIFHSQIVGKVVACVAKPVEMGIETQNQGVACRPYLGKCCLYTHELCFKSPYFPIRAVERRRNKDKNIYCGANPDGRQLQPSWPCAGLIPLRRP